MASIAETPTAPIAAFRCSHSAQTRPLRHTMMVLGGGAL